MSLRTIRVALLAGAAIMTAMFPSYGSPGEGEVVGQINVNTKEMPPEQAKEGDVVTFHVRYTPPVALEGLTIEAKPEDGIAIVSAPRIAVGKVQLGGVAVADFRVRLTATYGEFKIIAVGMQPGSTVGRFEMASSESLGKQPPREAGARQRRREAGAPPPAAEPLSPPPPSPPPAPSTKASAEPPQPRSGCACDVVR